LSFQELSQRSEEGRYARKVLIRVRVRSEREKREQEFPTGARRGRTAPAAAR
jgi:hypothetical protein